MRRINVSPLLTGVAAAIASLLVLQESGTSSGEGKASNRGAHHEGPNLSSNGDSPLDVQCELVDDGEERAATAEITWLGTSGTTIAVQWAYSDDAGNVFQVGEPEVIDVGEATSYEMQVSLQADSGTAYRQVRFVAAAETEEGGTIVQGGDCFLHFSAGEIAEVSLQDWISNSDISKGQPE